MKTLGLLGGMSWESSILYYKRINQLVRDRMGGLHSAKLVMHSFDFEDVAMLQRAGDWDGAAKTLGDAAIGLRNAGAEAILICTNTMHKLAAEVEQACGLPLLHIADATARKAKQMRLKRLALLGTAFTMEQDFYKARLRDHGLDIVVPEAEDRAEIHRIIFQELCQGVTCPKGKQRYLDIIASQGEIDGVILGCTEIGLLIGQDDLPIPVLDTTELHARAAVDWSLAPASTTSAL